MQRRIRAPVLQTHDFRRGNARRFRKLPFAEIPRFPSLDNGADNLKFRFQRVPFRLKFRVFHLFRKVFVKCDRMIHFLSASLRS